MKGPQWSSGIRTMFVGNRRYTRRGILGWPVLSILTSPFWPILKAQEAPRILLALPQDDVWTDTSCWGVVLQCTDKCGFNREIGEDIVRWSDSYNCGVCIGMPWLAR